MSEETYKITPKGIATLALLQTGLVNEMDDPRIDGFWTIFEAMMRRNEYIMEDTDD